MMIKNIKHAAVLAALLFAGAADMCAQSAIYACGHIRRQREKAITNLKTSGYTTAIIFNVNVEADGTLTTDYDWANQRPAEAGGIICRDGKYVFGEYQPHFVDDVKSLLEAPTTINRIELCIGGWGNGSYGNIRSLVNSAGTGAESILYRNFKALKEAIPEVVAVNNDQEQDYDVESATAFHRMLADIGYKTTVAPYMRKSYWQQLVAALNETPGTCDLVYLQTYGGGAGNNPADWKVFGDVPMYVGFDCEASDNIQDMVSKFERWRDNTDVVGGFLWNYNSEDRNLNEWATAVNRVFMTHPGEEPVATVYQNADFTGYSVDLPVGSFDNIGLALYGIKAKDISSLKINEGYRITLYAGNDCDGQSKEFTASTGYLGVSWIKRACSIKVELIDNSGVESVVCDGGGNVEVYDVAGRRMEAEHYSDIDNLPKGVYIVKADGTTSKIIRR